MAKQASKNRKTRHSQYEQPAPSPMPQPASAPTTADSWVSQQSVGDTAENLTLPSGNVARVRRIGPEAFMAQGLIPDPLTPLVDRAINSKKGAKPKLIDKEVGQMAKDPKKMGAMLEMLDRTVVYAVVKPQCSMPPGCKHEVSAGSDEARECGELDSQSVAVHTDPESDGYHEFEPSEREAGVLYVDRVDLEDKVFIMNFSMGNTRDLERFRAEHTKAVASVAAEQVTAQSA